MNFRIQYFIQRIVPNTIYLKLIISTNWLMYKFNLQFIILFQWHVHFK